MALYLGGSEKLQINFHNTIHLLNIYHSTTSTDGARLLSSDNDVLKDPNNAVLITEENN